MALPVIINIGEGFLLDQVAIKWSWATSSCAGLALHIRSDNSIAVIRRKTSRRISNDQILKTLGIFKMIDASVLCQIYKASVYERDGSALESLLGLHINIFN